MPIAAELRTIDPVLTTLAQGYANNAFVADKLFPIVEVDKSQGKVPLFGKGTFLKRNLDRAMGASSNRIPLTELELLDYECIERDVEMAIDYLEEEQTNEIYKYETRTVKELTDILSLGREIEAARIATSPSYYSDSHKIILPTGGGFNQEGSDPVVTLKTAIDSFRYNSGIMPNVMIMAKETFEVIREHAVMTEKLRYAGLSTIGKELVEEVIGIPNIYIGLSVYSEDGRTFSNVWNDSIVLASTHANLRKSSNELNMSYGCTIRRKGKPEVDSYFENGGKIKVIRNTDNYCIRILSKDASFLVCNVIQSES